MSANTRKYSHRDSERIEIVAGILAAGAVLCILGAAFSLVFEFI